MPMRLRKDNNEYMYEAYDKDKRGREQTSSKMN